MKKKRAYELLKNWQRSSIDVLGPLNDIVPNNGENNDNNNISNNISNS